MTPDELERELRTESKCVLSIFCWDPKSICAVAPFELLKDATLTVRSGRVQLRRVRGHQRVLGESLEILNTFPMMAPTANGRRQRD